MLNSIGLANPGRERFLAESLPKLRALGIPLWISVGGFCAQDYADTCEALDDVEAIELNLSCPNVDEAAESAAEIVAVCRAATALPLYAKLSAAHPDVVAVARAVAEAGADGLSLVNTLRGMALDPKTLEPVLARGTGGLSGPTLKPVALAAVHACYAATSLPIVGMGGVTTGQDALELIACGARHVALGTILFSDPDAPQRVRDELRSAAEAFGVAEPGDSLRARARGQKKPGQCAKSRSLIATRLVVMIGRSDVAHKNASTRAGPLARPADGRTETCERRQGQAGEAEEGPQGRPGAHRDDPRRTS